MTTWEDAWTSQRVKIRLRAGLTTLRRVDVGGFTTAMRTWWPDIIRDPREGYGYTEAPPPRIQANPGEISRMDEVMRWTAKWMTTQACTAAGMVPDAGWVTMSRARGWSWEQIGRARKTRYGQEHGLPGGNSRKSLMQIERKMLAWIATLLNNNGVSVDRATLDTSVPELGYLRDRDTRPYRRAGITVMAPPRGTVEIQQPPEGGC